MFYSLCKNISIYSDPEPWHHHHHHHVCMDRDGWVGLTGCSWLALAMRCCGRREHPCRDQRRSAGPRKCRLPSARTHSQHSTSWRPLKREIDRATSRFPMVLTSLLPNTSNGQHILLCTSKQCGCWFANQQTSMTHMLLANLPFPEETDKCEECRHEVHVVTV